MVRQELLVAESDPAIERNAADLIVADGEPGVPAADHQAVDS
jgi:hypothetical protein